MDTLYIFTDASTSPQNSIAVGAFLCLNQQSMDAYAQFSIETLFTTLSPYIIYKEYESKKSTWSEIKTVIHALNSVEKTNCKIELYTDCQSLCDLLGRRKEKLINNDFLTRSGKVHPNADLYKEFFAIAKKWQIQTFKIKGHHSISKRITLQEKIFSVLDKLSRQKLRSFL